jgi:magnesium transporter
MAEIVSTTKEQERPAGALDVDGQLVEDITALLDADQRGMVLNVVADLYAADVARLLRHLPFDEAWRLFHWLSTEQASEVLAELDGGYRAALLEEVRPERITAIIDELDTDDAADVLADLPEEIARQVLPGLEDAEDVQELLGYEEDTAGGIMGTEYVAVHPDMTVAEATEEVRRNAETVEEVFALFVADEQERLKGIVPLQRLLLSPSDALVSAIMDPDVISVRTDMDQEEVARIIERYDLVALPVVDEQGHLVGRITFDDIIDVIREEAEEDIRLISGVSAEERHSDSVVQISRGRLPWLLVGLFGATISGTVIKVFEGTLEQAVALASFIPIVTAMGGNAAVQSAAIAVQSLTSGDIWVGDLWRRIGREMSVALLNGLVTAALLCGFILLLNQVGIGSFGNPGRLAITVGLTMVTVFVLATTNGALVPFVLERLGVDPASSMGPFVTTLNDIIGLTVYFVFASLIYL